MATKSFARVIALVAVRDSPNRLHHLWGETAFVGEAGEERRFGDRKPGARIIQRAAIPVTLRTPAPDVCMKSFTAANECRVKNAGARIRARQSTSPYNVS